MHQNFQCIVDTACRQNSSPQKEQPASTKAGPMESLQLHIHAACAALGIPLQEAVRLLGNLDQIYWEQQVHTAAVKEQARSITKALLQEQKEPTGGRCVPPLSERMQRFDIPAYVDREQILQAVLTLLSPPRSSSPVHPHS